MFFSSFSFFVVDGYCSYIKIYKYKNDCIVCSLMVRKRERERDNKKQNNISDGGLFITITLFRLLLII